MVYAHAKAELVKVRSKIGTDCDNIAERNGEIRLSRILLQ